MDADIYVINRENVCWLVSQYRGSLPFDMLVIDELSSFKNPKAQRFKALRLVRPQIDRVVGLTGTPAPNGLCDIWSQIYLLDQGERLEKQLRNTGKNIFVLDAVTGRWCLITRSWTVRRKRYTKNIRYLRFYESGRLFGVTAADGSYSLCYHAGSCPVTI